MKNVTKVLGTLSAVLLMGTGAFAQRQCNLAPTMVSPTENQIFPAGDTMRLTFTIKNNGPASIIAGDTIFYGIGSDVYAHVATAAIANGATSAPITPGIFFTNTTTADITGSVCVTLLDQSLITYNTTPPTPALITYVDADTTNDETCRTVTLKAKPTSVLNLNNKNEQLNFYPNPATADVNFALSLEKAENVIVSVKDITGREVMRNDFGKVQAGQAPFKINVANLNNGIYFIELNAGERKAVGKMNVRH
mgnify:CR=1 FL=1